MSAILYYTPQRLHATCHESDSRKIENLFIEMGGLMMYVFERYLIYIMWQCLNKQNTRIPGIASSICKKMQI